MKTKQGMVFPARMLAVAAAAIVSAAGMTACGDDNGVAPVARSTACRAVDETSVELSLEIADWDEEVTVTLDPVTREIMGTIFRGSAYPGVAVEATPGDTVSVIFKFRDAITCTETIGRDVRIAFGGVFTGQVYRIGPSHELPASALGTMTLNPAFSQFNMHQNDATDNVLAASLRAPDPAPDETLYCVTARVVVPESIQGIALPDPTRFAIDYATTAPLTGSPE